MKKLRPLLLWPVIVVVVALAVLYFLGYLPIGLYIAGGVLALYVLIFRLKPRTSIVLLVFAGIVVGLYLVGLAIFHESPFTIFTASIHIPRPRPEAIFRIHLGGLELPITNTVFSSFFSMLILVILATLVWWGLRRRSEEERLKNPRGWQNLVEWMLEYVIKLLEPAAGKGKLKKRPLGRLIFPLVGTLFIFIIFANWLSLFPFFSTIMVKPPYHFVPVGKVSFERVAPAAEICAGDTVTFYATAPEATEPHYEWYVNDAPQVVEEEAWLDYTFTEANTVTVRVEAWNQEEGLRHTAVYSEALRPASGEAAKTAGCDTPARPPTAAAPHTEHKSPGLVWFFDNGTPAEPVPVLRAPNSHLAITAGMAILSFLVVQTLAVIAHGPIGYLKHLATDAPVWMRFIMFPIHVISEFSRIISLSARLFGNLYGGDVLLAVIFTLLAPLVPAIFLGIEAFFYYIQALLFSVLTTVYIVLAVGGGHEEAHAH
jgi:F0F1-type ATP synthase membrane subunit a